LLKEIILEEVAKEYYAELKKLEPEALQSSESGSPTDCLEKRSKLEKQKICDDHCKEPHEVLSEGARQASFPPFTTASSRGTSSFSTDEVKL